MRPSRAKRLARRYPLLRDIPEDERAGIVREALKSPLVLVPLLGGGLLLLPLYLQYMFALLGVETEQNLLLMLAKVLGTALVPILVIVPLFTRFIMPRCIRKVLQRRGYKVE